MTKDISGGSRPRLKRLGTAFLERDWMAIAIEIVVVTLGVLIAFQVDQWGSDWRHRKEERQFLERVYRENAFGIDELRKIVPAHRRNAEDLAAVIRSRNDPRQLAQFARSENFGCGAATVSSSGFSDTAYGELLEPGRLAIVGDLDLRDQLRRLGASSAASIRERDFAGQLIQVVLPEINQYYQLDLASGPDLTCRIEWSSLVGDDRAFNAIALAYRVQQVLAATRSSTLAVAEETQAELACVIGKPGCGSR